MTNSLTIPTQLNYCLEKTTLGSKRYKEKPEPLCKLIDNILEIRNQIAHEGSIIPTVNIDEITEQFNYEVEEIYSLLGGHFKINLPQPYEK